MFYGLFGKKNEKGSDMNKNQGEAAPSKIKEPKFVEIQQRGTFTYEKYFVQDTISAKAFLQKRKVDKPNYYVQVETNESDKQTGQGIWGIDREGMYLTKLFRWQRDLSLAKCTGTITKPPTSYAANIAKMNYSDNFTCHITCGSCGHEWLDAVAWQNDTVVKCPNCGKYNKIDSRCVMIE